MRMCSPGGPLLALWAWSNQLSRPIPSSQPRLAPGCRWGTRDEQPVLLFPEGMVRLQGAAQYILELCDGHRTLEEIMATLKERYVSSSEQKISEDVHSFLEALQKRRLLDY
jgi:pyrroloquinoline quinone biosynthesis protein D